MAGNWSTLQTASVKVDSVPPSTTVSLAWTMGSNGWYNTPVQVTLNSSDATSGVGSISLDGTAYTTPRTYGDGTHTLTYFATDNAGNAETAHNLTFKVDSTAPAASSSLAGTAGSNGWYVSPVQITVSGSDATSGLNALELNGSAYSAPATVNTQGVTNYTYRAQDVAGNWSALQNGSFKIDTVAPSTTASLGGTMGSNGWYNTPVQVTLNPSDAISGVGSISLDGTAYLGPRPYADGAHTITYSSTDNAGNAETAKMLSFNVDTVPPTVTEAQTGTLGLAGWYVSPVTMTLSGTDATSGLAALQLNSSAYVSPVVFSAQGTTNYSYRGRDVAGNWSTFQGGALKIDTVPPTTTVSLSATLGLHNIYVTPVQVTLSSLDAASGVAQITLDGTPYTGPRVYTDGMHSLTYSAVDVAGNAENPHTLTFSVDTMIPQTMATVTGPKKNNSGWYTGDVTVSFTAITPNTQIYVDGQLNTGPLKYSGDGWYTLHYHGVDLAGNTEGDQTVSFKIDGAAPAQSGSATLQPDGTISLDLYLVDTVSGVDSGGIYVMSPDWKILKVFSFSGANGHFDWNGLLDDGSRPPAGYFLLFYGRDRAGNDAWHSLGGPVPAGTPPPTVLPTATPGITLWPTWTRTATPRLTGTPGPTAMPGVTGTDTPTPSPTPTGSPTVALPVPPQATYAPLPTPTRVAAAVVLPSLPPFELRLNLWLVIVISFSLAALLLALALNAHSDPRPRAVRETAEALQRLMRFDGEK